MKSIQLDMYAHGIQDHSTSLSKQYFDHLLNVVGGLATVKGLQEQDSIGPAESIRLNQATEPTFPSACFGHPPFN